MQHFRPTSSSTARTGSARRTHGGELACASGEGRSVPVAPVSVAPISAQPVPVALQGLSARQQGGRGRQETRGSRSRVPLALLGTLGLVGGLLSACTSDEAGLNMLDGPMDVTIQDANEVFDVPVAFVTNFRSGRIVKLDLKHETYLRDLPYASWVRSGPLATGDDRFLEHVASYTRYASADDFTVSVLATDSTRAQLLTIPYLEAGFEPLPGCMPFTPGIPRRPLCIPELSGQLSVNQSLREGSLPLVGPEGTEISGASVTGFWLREGRTTTEDWHVLYDAARGTFRVVGSRSGLQVAEASPNEIYYSDHNEIEFQVVVPEGTTLETGAGLEFSTDSGLKELELGGLAGDLKVLPEQGLALVALQVNPLDETQPDAQEAATGSGYLVGIDVQAAQAGEVSPTSFRLQLCPDALEPDGSCATEVIPSGMDVDKTGQRVFIADAGDGGVVYEVDLTAEPPAVTVLHGFGPNLDVAWVEDRTVENGFQHLFVATLDDGDVYVYDRRANRMLDVNPLTAPIDPVLLRTPVRALAASQVPVDIREASDEQVPLQSILVAASTFDGQIYAIKGENGCLTYASPARASVSTSTDSIGLSEDRGVPSNPTMMSMSGGNGDTLAILNSCGGISPTETWTFSYDALAGGYKVRGSVTNPPGEYMTLLAYENERYVSDGGEISVYIQTGTLPTSDGDTFSLAITGNITPYTTSSYTGDLEIYTQTYGDRNQPWTPVNFRSVAVVPVIASDSILKLDMAWLSNTYSAELAEFK